ncbi:hypothetical protein IFM89_015990 [Coptis chinensis]|uniref:Cytochrome b561 and DOMON domain-containing protein n=1 Tax=Coptis chinensis TaxID=261450 RepID=A0A835HKB6_9MAGN|nr:hypothetical protein IFM89_015990 [Coptis chinensis]
MAGSNESNVFCSRAYYVFITIILFLHTWNFSVVAKAENIAAMNMCDSNVSSILPVPYGNIFDYSCLPVWKTFALRVSFRLLQIFRSNNHVMTFVLSAGYTSGWVGMGFSKDGLMVGSSAMVGWVDSEGRASIKQYYLRGFTPADVLPDKGELQLTKVPPAVVLNGKTIYLAFQLKVHDLTKAQPILLSFGTKSPVHNKLSIHDDETTILYDLSAGTLIYSFNSIDLKKNHGVLAITGFGVLLPAGAIVARYLRHRDPLWIYLHASIQFIGFVVGLSTVVAGKVLYERTHVMLPVHRDIGLFIVALCILQTMAFFLRPDKDAKIRRCWNLYHNWLGRLVLFLAALNILLGIEVGGSGSTWKIGYGFILAINLLTVIICEVLLRRKKSEETRPSAYQFNIL